MKKICRIITDNKQGNINPAFALAEIISDQLDFEIEHIQVKSKWFLKIIPVYLIKRLRLHRFIAWCYKIPYNYNVALTIGNGSTSIIPCASLKMNKKYQSLFIQLQNPRIHPSYFDYIVSPLHDHIRGKNVITTIGSLSRVERMINIKDPVKLPIAIAELNKPIIAVFIGGNSSRYKFSIDEATKLAQYLLNFSITNKVSLAITCSRRTGKKEENILRQLLTGDNIYFPDHTEDNPYYAMLKYCEASIVTCDSVNMISDSIVAGLQTFLYTLPGNHGKFVHFFNALKRRGLLFDTTTEYRRKSVGRLNETQRVSKIIIAALTKNNHKDIAHG